MRVLILAAGRGTRISRYLSGKPKCTVDIGNGLCLIQYTVELLKSRGIDRIGIVLGYQSQVIREVLEGSGAEFFCQSLLRCDKQHCLCLVCQGLSRGGRV